eukprot:8059620-Pyramimonas_sp.AAC.1
MFSNPVMKQHLTRIRWHGNPHAYAVWQDEALNICLRSAAERSSHVDSQVFRMFALLSDLGVSKYIYVPKASST